MAGIQAGTAWIPVKADMSQFGKDIDRGAGKAEGSLKTFAKRAGTLLAGAFVVDKAKDFFATSVAGAREAIAIDRQTAAVIKSTGGVANVTAKMVDDLANRIQKTHTVNDELVQGGANLLLTFTNVRNEVGKGNDVFDQAVGLATDMSVALGQDMKSSSIQLGKALNDPIKGVSALQRVGVSFTEQQKEQIKTLVASGKTLDAQKVILKELGTQFGGSAAAQADAGKKMALAWDDFQEVVGRILVPLVDKLLKSLTKVAEWAAENPTQLKIVAGVIGGALTLAFTAWAISAATAAAATIAAAAPVIALGVAIGALIAGAVYVWKNWEDIWTKLRDFTGKALDAVVGFVQSLPGRMLSVLRTAWTAYWNFYTGLLRSVAQFASDRIADIVGYFRGLPVRVRDAVFEGVGILQELGKSVVSKILSGVMFMADHAVGLRGWLVGLPGRVLNWVMEGAGKLLDLGKKMVGKVIEGITGKASGIGRALLEAVPGGRGLADAYDAITGDGPGRPTSGGSALARVQRVLSQFPGARISSTYRDPARNRRAGGSPNSYHLDRSNPAVDIVPASARMGDQIASKLRQMGGWRELLWRVPNHAPGDNMHIHVAHDGGIVEPSWPTFAGLGPHERPAILEVGETVLPKDFAGGGIPNPDDWGRRAAKAYARELKLEMRTA